MIEIAGTSPAMTYRSILAAESRPRHRQISPQPDEGDGAPVGAASFSFDVSFRKRHAFRRSIAAFWRAATGHLPLTPDRACERKATRLAPSSWLPAHGS